MIVYMRVVHIIKRKNITVLSGTVFNHICNISGASSKTGKLSKYIKKNEKRELRNINVCIDSKSPCAYVFTICGLRAI